jgi:hypothetical protein
MCWGLFVSKSTKKKKTAANQLLSRKFTLFTMRESFNHLLFIIDALKPRQFVSVSFELISDLITLKTNHEAPQS